LLSSNAHLLNEIDKKTSAVLRSLRLLYEEMSKSMNEHEQEQVRAVKEYQENSKAEIQAYSRELSSLSTYLSQKSRFYLSLAHNSQSLVASRSILEVIVLSSKLISDSLLDPDKYVSPTDPERIARIGGEIEGKVKDIIVPFNMRPVLPNRSGNRSASRSVFLRETSVRKNGQGLKSIPHSSSMQIMQHRRSVF
jgi:hypothetical protein